jgi:hypothetical protein
MVADQRLETQQQITQTDARLFLQGNSTPFLKAAEIKGRQAKVTIENVREADLQFSGRTLILDIQYKKETRSIPLNKVNTKKMIELFGYDYTKWIGKEITLYKVVVTNPKTRQEVESIRIK